jgi:hypothetical protein
MPKGVRLKPEQVVAKLREIVKSPRFLEPFRSRGYGDFVMA